MATKTNPLFDTNAGSRAEAMKAELLEQARKEAREELKAERRRRAEAKAYKHVTFIIDRELLSQFRAYCEENGLTQRNAIESSIRKFIKTKKTAK